MRGANNRCCIAQNAAVLQGFFVCDAADAVAAHFSYLASKQLEADIICVLANRCSAANKKKHWRTVMEMPVEQKQTMQSSIARRGTDELIKLIRKLRWMGREDEEARLQTELRRQRSTAADSVLAAPCDTD